MTAAERMAGGAAAFHVAVMAKYPRLGSVKTRLARAIGSAAAAALSRAFILDLHDRLRQERIAQTWAYWPPEAPFAALLPGASCLAQSGTDLGERMRGVLVHLLRAHAIPVVLLGADLPHVDLAVVRRAGEALAAGDDIVLGPAADGGYYLLGVRRDLPEIFRGVRWGGPDVYAQTYARCRALGVTPLVLPEAFDVDEGADLERLTALLAREVVCLPHTRAALARFRLSRPSTYRPE